MPIRHAFYPIPPEIQEKAVSVDLNRPMNEIRSELSRHPVTTRLLLNGRIVVARDIAHARILEQLEKAVSCHGTSKTISSIMQGLPKRPRDTLPDLSAPPLLREWTRMSQFFRNTVVQ
jgi:fumarate hydratase, class I